MLVSIDNQAHVSICFDTIFGHAIAKVIAVTQVEEGINITLISGLAIPLNGLGLIVEGN